MTQTDIWSMAYFADGWAFGDNPGGLWGGIRQSLVFGGAKGIMAIVMVYLAVIRLRKARGEK